MHDPDIFESDLSMPCLQANDLIMEIEATVPQVEWVFKLWSSLQVLQVFLCMSRLTMS